MAHEPGIEIVMLRPAGKSGRSCAGPIASSLISIIVPTLDEDDTVVATLEPLQPWRGRGIEIIVIDGGSHDNTVEVARPLADLLDVARRGRAAQMNAGATFARGDVLLFLHADTRLPPEFTELIRNALADRNRVWGRFNARINSPNPILWVVSRMMDVRSHCSGIATGDQALFVRRSAFDRIGGFPEIPLMEDIAFSKALKRLSWPARICVPVVTSSRRWESHGILRTIVLMWSLRWAYFRGADPARLAERYGSGGRDG